MSVRTSVEAQEAARLLITHGRAWLDLTDEQIAHGARALTNSRSYRAVVYRDAVRRARDLRDGLLLLALMDAMDVLALNDESETT